MKKFLAALILSATCCAAQNISSSISSAENLIAPADQAVGNPLPQAPQPPKQPKNIDPQFDYLYWAGLYCGTGASISTVSNKPTIGCGAGISMIPGTFFEIGVMGPQANRSSASGYLSLDGKIPLSTRGLLYVPTAIIGYTRMFETGHALDYGLAFDSPAIKGNQSYGENYIRIELRDYYTFANPNQHNVMLRVGWMTGLPD